MNRRGFSATEVLIAAGLLAVSMIPVIGLISGGAKPAAFSEYHLQAQARAKQAADRLQDLILSHGFSEITAMPVGERVAAADTKTYKLAADDDAMKTAEGGWVNAPELYLTSLADGGSLVQITAIVNWTVPADPIKHSFSFQRLLSRPEGGLVSDYQPRQVAGGK